MAETRGYETIVDRTDGWGHSEGTNPSADATPEVVADRVDRSLAARKSFKEAVDSSIADRGLTEQQFADAAADYKNGVFVDEAGDPETGTGSNTEHTATDTAALASARTSTALPTSDLVEPGIETVGSIVDRTDGWGHEDGTQSDRKDA